MPRITARQIMDRFYAAELVYMSSPPDEANFTDIAATLSPDLKLYQTAALPYGGVYEGHAGFLAWAKEMSKRFDMVDVAESTRKFLESDDVIVILSELRLRVRATGERLDYPFCQTVKVDLEKGVITEIRPWYWDVAGLNTALARTGESGSLARICLGS